jgi:hypothetical protein
LKRITDSPEYHGLQISEPGAIGHNNPPESIVENPLDTESVAQLQNALATIKAQAASPNDRGRQAKDVAATLNAQKEKWSEWLARHGNTFVDAAAKEAGKRSIQWVHGAIVLLYAYLAGLTDLIAAWVRLLS